MRTYKIKEISQIINGATPSTTNLLFWGGDIIWLTPKDLTNFSSKYIYSGHATITRAGYDSCSTKLVPIGTVLLSSRALIGYLAIAGRELCTNQGFKSIVCNKSLVNNEYLYYWFSTRGDYLQSISNGATFKELSKDTLENVLIDLPNLDEQQHIVNTIGTVDDLIEKKTQTLLKLQNISRLIYLKHKSQREGTFLLGECCDIKTGKLDANAEDKNGKYPFFTCGQETLKINDYAFDCEAIIISGNGEISVRYHKGKFNAYQRTYVLSPTKLFYLFLEECKLSINDLKNNSQGSVIKFITKGMLESIKIVNDNDSSIINEKIGEIYKNVLNIKQELDILKNTKAKLLSKYF